MTECCEKCKHYAKLEHNFEHGLGFDYDHCCTFFAKDGMITQVNANDICEEFTPKENET